MPEWSKKLSKKGIIGVSGYFLAPPSPLFATTCVCQVFLHQPDNQDEDKNQDQDDHEDCNQNDYQDDLEERNIKGQDQDENQGDYHEDPENCNKDEDTDEYEGKDQDEPLCHLVTINATNASGPTW